MSVCMSGLGVNTIFSADNKDRDNFFEQIHPTYFVQIQMPGLMINKNKGYMGCSFPISSHRGGF